ncbi:MAG: 50S ribosomal protein L9 [Methylococcales bacterium]|nr:50S ribosomal protein L9 [Methylococcales bacterium]
MEVILLEKVANLGNFGDRVKIKSGFGRNFLIPQGKAVMATASRIAEFEARRAELEKAAQEKLSAAEQKANALADLKVVIQHKAGEEGKLFGSVTAQQIAEAVTAAGVTLTKQAIRLPEGALRHVGDHQVSVHLHADVDADAEFTVTIQAES